MGASCLHVRGCACTEIPFAGFRPIRAPTDEIRAIRAMGALPKAGAKEWIELTHATVCVCNLPKVRTLLSYVGDPRGTPVATTQVLRLSLPPSSPTVALEGRIH